MMVAALCDEPKPAMCDLAGLCLFIRRFAICLEQLAGSLRKPACLTDCALPTLANPAQRGDGFDEGGMEYTAFTVVARESGGTENWRCVWPIIYLTAVQSNYSLRQL